jgi:transcriptional regulator with XRE-family HTH domain
MARPPKFIHPLRRLRSVIGLSQKAFAEFIGVPSPTIEATENGRLPMSKRLAKRIYWATGIKYSELVKGVNAKLVNNAGKKYSLRHFRDWQKEYESPSKQEIDVLLSVPLGHVKKSLETAARRRRFAAAFSDIAEAMESAAARVEQQTESEI